MSDQTNEINDTNSIENEEAQAAAEALDETPAEESNASNVHETNGHSETPLQTSEEATPVTTATATPPTPRKAPIPRTKPVTPKPVASKPAAARTVPATKPAVKATKPAPAAKPKPGKADKPATKPTAPKPKTPGAKLSMEQRDAAQADKEIRWTPIKLALLAAIKKAGGTSAAAAVLPVNIAKVSNGKLTEDVVKRQTNNHFDLMIQGFIKKTPTAEGPLGIYLTAKGLKVDLTPKTEKPASKGKGSK